VARPLRLGWLFPLDGHTSAGPLDGVIVLDLSRVLTGPFAAMLLGDLGARVIKVERPGHGDDTRNWGPPFAGPADAAESTYFLSANRNKQSVSLDLKSDRTRLLQLISRADILVENFRPGVMDRLGLGAAELRELNPRLVVLSITGFGHDGPDAGRPGYDQIVQGEAGIMSLTGMDADHPTKVGIPIADLLAGIYGALGAVAALHERGTTGRGGVVRTSLLAAVVATHAFQGTRYLIAEEVPEPSGNQHPTVAPYGAFTCQDGVIQIAVGNDDLWRRLAEVVGMDADDPSFRTNADRLEHTYALQESLRTAFRSEPVDAWMTRLDAAGIPAGRINSLNEVYASPQVRSQGLVIAVDHATLGRIELPGPALRFDDLPERAHRAPPFLGQDTEEVFRWLDSEPER